MSDQIGYGRQWFAYRCYDAHGQLLYSGSTSSVERRMKEHRHVTGRRWIAQVARVEVEEFNSRWRAALAERSYAPGRFGTIPGGIGKALAASLSDDELIEALSHPAYRENATPYTVGVQWGLGMQRAREIWERYEKSAHDEGIPETGVAADLGVDRMTVRKWLGKR